MPRISDPDARDIADSIPWMAWSEPAAAAWVAKRKSGLSTLIEKLLSNPKKLDDIKSEELYNLFGSANKDIIYNKKKSKQESKENE